MPETLADPAAAYLAEAKQRAREEILCSDRAPEDPPWSCEDVPRLAAAVEVALARHQRSGRRSECLTPSRMARPMRRARPATSASRPK